MIKSKIATSIKKSRTAGLPLPKKTSNDDLLRWWKSFIDGDAAVFIAEREGKQVSVIEKGLAYIAAKLGAPSAYVEKCRLIESYHRSMVDINQQLAKCNANVAELDSVLERINKPQYDLDGNELVPDTKLWLSVAAQRTSEQALRIKLYQELRSISVALENIFGLKHLAVPENPDQEEAVLSNLDKMSIPELTRLLEAADDSSIQDAVEVPEYAEPVKSF